MKVIFFTQIPTKCQIRGDAVKMLRLHTSTEVKHEQGADMGKMQPVAVISVFILNPGFDVPSYRAPCLPPRNSHVMASRVASCTAAAKYLRASLTVTDTNVGWRISP
jgi:hypothetical protein